MTSWRKLEQKLGRFAIPNLTLGLIACQVLAYVLGLGEPELLGRLALVPQSVYAGEVWRLVTFLFMPPAINLIFAFFFWYLFYLMGTALEQTWGTFRYNAYLGIGYLASILLAFFAPNMEASNAFLQGSVFLAFAYLYPDFVLNLMLIIPVKIKWLALLAWVGYGFVLLTGSMMERLMVLAAVLNFFVFFGGDLWRRVRSGRRRAAFQSRQTTSTGKAFHRCEVCGITDKSNPDETFRYCSTCVGAKCYCSQHLTNHTHVTEDVSAEARDADSSA